MSDKSATDKTASDKNHNGLGKTFNVNDRVRRVITEGQGLMGAQTTRGCYGVVKDVRTEVTASSGNSKDRGFMIQVLWDNGTLSYFAPEALEVVKE